MTRCTLSQSAIEKLGYYVYLLIDPRNHEVFYIGKGKGNRINQHLLGASDAKNCETEKNKKIREIQDSGLEVEHFILRHELTEKEAFEVESAIIDFVGIKKLTNLAKGHYSEDRGLMKLEDIKIKYEAENVTIKEPVILININNLYRRNLTKNEIYEATRKSWRININRVENIKIACSVYRGIVREIFVIKKWLPSTKVNGRYMFEGNIAPESLRKIYINKSVSKYWKKGSQNPIKYVEPKN